MTQYKVQGLGWIPDLPDQRDLICATPESREAQPPLCDLRVGFPPVYDQGKLGSCTANALAACIEYEYNRRNLPAFAPSRLFIYYNERAIEGTTYIDSGAMLRSGIKSINRTGLCAEEAWPYDGRSVLEKPSQACYDSASKEYMLSYRRIVPGLLQMKACLNAGTPFLFGFTCYESLETGQVEETGDIPLPYSEESVLGGHMLVAVGYDEARQVFFVRNSWGKSWGQEGYGTIPFVYLLDPNLAASFWAIQLVERSRAGKQLERADERANPRGGPPGDPPPGQPFGPRVRQRDPDPGPHDPPPGQTR